MKKRNNTELTFGFINGDGDEIASTGHLRIDGNKLIHFNTTIAERYEGKIIVNESFYSSTTGTLQKLLKENIPYEEYIRAVGVKKDYIGSLKKYIDEKKSLTEQFLKKYVELETFAKQKYANTNAKIALEQLEHDGLYSDVRDEIELCRKIRNVLTHNPRISNDYVIEINPKMLSFLEALIESVKNPIKAMDFCITLSNVYSKKITDLVKPTMIDMNRQIYTNVPIIDKGVVVGVFSENTIFTYLSEKTIVDVDDITTFVDLKKYLPIGAHRAESYYFISKKMLISDIRSMFQEALTKGERVGMLFVTENGKETEKLLGIITPWDIAPIEGTLKKIMNNPFSYKG